MLKEITQINNVLDLLSKRNAIHNLSLSTAGIQLKSGLKIFFEYVEESNRLYIYTPLLLIPKDSPRRLALYESMLSCNFLNLECSAGTLAIFLRTEEAVYQIGLDLAMLNTDRLDSALHELIDQRDTTLHQLEQAKNGNAGAVRHASMAPGTYHHLAAAARIQMEPLKR